MRGKISLGIVSTLAALTGCQSVYVPEMAQEPKPAVLPSLEQFPQKAMSAEVELKSRNGDFAASENKPGLLVRVVDTGQALCIVGITADGYSFLIDAGHWNGRQCLSAVAELLPEKGGLSLVVLTHNDSDHLGDLPSILERHVDTILWTGREPVKCRGVGSGCAGTYRAAREAIGRAAQRGSTVINLKTTALAPGQRFLLGDVGVMFLAGWNEFPNVQGLSPSEQENAVSIMTRISYGGSSLLVTGDAIGRSLGGAENECHGSEAWVLQHLNPDWLKSDVLVASHHGGDNGSANCFIDAVSPEYVIFSAGTHHDHPRQSTAERFLRHGIPSDRLLRTDRGSNSESKEWIDGLTPRCGDEPGDDSIGIVFSDQRQMSVGYLAVDRCSRN